MMGKKTKERILMLLKEIHRTSTMKDCAIANEHKEAMALWIKSWIENPLSRVIYLIEKNAKYEVWNNSFNVIDGNEEITYDFYGYEKNRSRLPND